MVVFDFMFGAIGWGVSALIIVFIVGLVYEGWRSWRGWNLEPVAAPIRYGTWAFIAGFALWGAVTAVA